MHICLDFRPALRQATGVGTYVHNLMVALSAAHPEHRYTAFSASWKDRLAAVPDAEGVQISDWRVPVRCLDWLWHRWGWPGVERFVGAVDIAHSPSPMLLPARRARKVVTVHDCYFMRHPEDVFGPVRRDYVPLARRSVQRADAVVAVSASTAAEVEELMGVPRERIEVTHLGVADAFFDTPALDVEQVRDRHGLAGPYLLFVGRRERRKDLGTLLGAFERLLDAGHELQLALVGPDAPGWSETFSAVSPAVRQATRLIAHQPAETLVALYTGAAAVVMPSRWEGFGLPGLEAMAAGTPVVASRVGSLPEVLGKAALFADAGDPEQLAAQCSRVLEDTELAARLVTDGKQQARRFRWSETARRTHELYRRLLD